MRTLGARFAGSSTVYSYYIPEGDDPRVGDVVVTSVQWETETSDDDGMPINPALSLKRDEIASILVAKDSRLATVVEIDVAPAGRANKFYVALLPAKDLIARRDANFRLMAKIKREREITAKLDRMLAQEDKTARYARLAASNPVAAELMRELGLLPAPTAGADQ